VEQVPFAVGYMTLPAMAYYLRDWNNLQLSFGLISTGLIVYYWILPDSPRWLATHGKTEKAIECLYKVAKVNRLPKPKHQDLVEIIKTCHDDTELQRRYSIRVGTDPPKATSSSGFKPGHESDDEARVKITEAKRNEPVSTTSDNFSRLIQTLHKWLKGFVKNFKSLMQTAEIRKRSFVFWTIFMVVAMVYYGIVFSGNLTSDPYLLFFLG